MERRQRLLLPCCRLESRCLQALFRRARTSFHRGQRQGSDHEKQPTNRQNEPMSAPAAAPPPSAPAAPAPAPAPAPAHAAPAAPERGADDPQLKSIFDDLGVVIAKEPAAPPAPVPTPASPTPAPPAPAASPAAPAASAPQPAGSPAAPSASPPAPAGPPAVAVRRDQPIAQVVEDVLRKVMGAAPPTPAALPPPPAPAAPQPSPDEVYVESLGPEEKETIALAKWAEENVPDQKGLAGKFVSFYKAVDEYVNAERAKDPKRTFDESDEAFTTFVEGARPQIEPGKWEELKRGRLIAQVESAATKKVEETRKRQNVLEKKPLIEDRIRAFQANIGGLMNAEPADSILPTIVKSIEANGLEKTIEADPIFTPIVVQAYGQGERAAAEFLAMAHGVKDYDANDKVHDWVIKFIRRAGETFAAKGGDKLVRQTEDGAKTFLPRGQYNQLLVSNPQQAGRHWTFSDEDVVRMIERNTKDHIAALVKAESDRLIKTNYIKPPPTTPTPTTPIPGNANPSPTAPSASAAPPPEPVGSPRAGVTPAPGQGNGAVNQQQVMSDAELQVLGFPRK